MRSLSLSVSVLHAIGGVVPYYVYILCACVLFVLCILLFNQLFGVCYERSRSY